MAGLYARPVNNEPTKALQVAEIFTSHASSVARQAIDGDPQLIAFVLPSIPESVRIARFHIRAALGLNQLSEYADDAETITSELVTNAIQHACGGDTETVGVILLRMRNPETVTVVVTDPSPGGLVIREPSHHSDHGRGLLIVDQLSVCWGWNSGDGGKAVYAILAKAGGA
jgi:serine/threonine-protein kinase RsbW